MKKNNGGVINRDIQYNVFFRNNKSKFQLFIDNSEMSEENTAKRITEFLIRQNSEERT